MNAEYFMKHSGEIETGLSEEDNIYKENILDHYKNPHNKGEIKHNSSIRELNPTCGDEITVFLEIKDSKVKDASFTGHGCAISQAGISMLTDNIKGMNINDVKKIKNEDIYKMLGIKITVPRIRCALLSLKAVNSAVKNYEIRNN